MGLEGLAGDHVDREVHLVAALQPGQRGRSWERNTFPNATAWSIITMALFSEVRGGDDMMLS